jgi:hypothetical protein
MHANLKWYDRLNSGAAQQRIETESKLAWGAGARAVVYQADNTCIALSGEYNAAKPKVERAVYGASSAETAGLKLKHRDWNVGLALSHQIDMLTPYVGVNYSKVKTSFNATAARVTSDNSIALGDLQARNKVGMVVGCNVVAGKKAALGIEGRFISQNAVAVSADVRF